MSGRAHKMFFIDLVVKTEDGEVVVETEAGDPVGFHIGAGEMLEGVEEAVVGLKEGESVELPLSVDKAFGPHDPEKIHPVPRSDFPDDVELEPGTALALEDEEGNEVEFAVDRIEGDTVYCDFNHPAAGIPVIATVTLVKIEEHAAHEHG